MKKIFAITVFATFIFSQYIWVEQPSATEQGISNDNIISVAQNSDKKNWRKDHKPKRQFEHKRHDARDERYGKRHDNGNRGKGHDRKPDLKDPSRDRHEPKHDMRNDGHNRPRPDMRHGPDMRNERPDLHRPEAGRPDHRPGFENHFPKPPHIPTN